MIGRVLLLPLVLLHCEGALHLLHRLVLDLILELDDAFVDTFEVVQLAVLDGEVVVENFKCSLCFKPAFESKGPEEHLFHVVGDELLLGELEGQRVHTLLQSVVVAVGYRLEVHQSFL